MRCTEVLPLHQKYYMASSFSSQSHTILSELFIQDVSIFIAAKAQQIT